MNLRKTTHGAVIVTRVSTGKQLTGTSPEVQLERCREKALKLGLSIVAEYFDAGISGAFLLLREGMQAAITDIRAGRASVLICPNMDRYSREPEHQQRIRREVRNAGGRIVFCDMDFDDTPEGDFAFGMFGGFAAYERARFRKRSMDGKQRRAEAGLQPSRSFAPYAYHIVTKADVIAGRYSQDMTGRYVVIPEQSVIVKRIFESFASGGLSLHGICKELNTEGVPTSRGGAMWRPATVKNILANGVYMGKAGYRKVLHTLDEARTTETDPRTGKPYKTPIIRRANDAEDIITIEAPAIVTPELWQSAQDRRAFNKAHKSGNPARVRMLSGWLRCPLCGGGMRHTNDHGYHYFCCGRSMDARDHAARAVCESTHFREDSLEAAVISAITVAVETPEAVAAQLQVYRRESRLNEVNTVKLEEVTTAIANLAKDESTAVEAQIAGTRAGASPDAYSAVFASLSSRRRALEEKRIKLADAVQQPVQNGSASNDKLRRRGIVDLHAALTSLEITGAVRRDLLGRIVHYVVPRKDGAEVNFLPGIFGDETVHGISTPQPR